MNFDKLTDRRGTKSQKWDRMTAYFDVPADALPMWVADSDFEVAPCITAAMQKMVDHGIYGYMGDQSEYKAAIAWWMRHRHGWKIEEAAINTTFGLCNGLAIALEAFTAPGDAAVLFTPVYHAFARVIRAAGRAVTECRLGEEHGRFTLDWAAAEAALTGRERVLVWCSPHNPGGRVWTREELGEVAEFARRHDLLLISDEIHHDILMPGQEHTVMAKIEGVEERLVMLTAASKTFNLAGLHSGNVIIPDPGLRKRFQARMTGLSIATTSAGLIATTAAYSPEGAAWADAQNAYLAENFRLFAAGVRAIPGVRVMDLQATFLVWVDFRGLGMDDAEIARRVERVAGIAANRGTAFGSGGEGHTRFNIATQRVRVEEAVGRLSRAFADLQ